MLINYIRDRLGDRTTIELESLREEHVDLIRDNALLRAELTRLRKAPRHIAHAQQAATDASRARMQTEKMCDALKGELREAIALAADCAGHQKGSSGEVICLC